jgi:hypothetical protein
MLGRHIAAYELTLDVRVVVFLTGVVVAPLVGRLVRNELLEEAQVVLLQPLLVVVNENRGDLMPFSYYSGTP